MNRVLAIARKEVFHILRDPFTLALALVLPMAMILLFGEAIEFNPKDATLAVWDSDHTQTSRRVTETLGASGYFKPFPVRSADEGTRAVEGGHAKGLLVVPPGFEKDLLSGHGGRLQVLLDGSDNTFAGVMASYFADVQARLEVRLLDRDPQPSRGLRARYLFNPELNSKWFAVPGLAVVIMSIISILLTTLTVAREWELGSMELLLSTPVKPIEIILGKLSPYAALGMIGLFFVYVLARGVFGVPFAGRHAVFLLGSFLFLCTYLAQGLLISVVTRKQQIAMQLGIMSGLLPSQLLSGFIFPIENMPRFFQILTAVLPARWYMAIVRDQFLRGSSFYDLRVPFLALLGIFGLFVFLAGRKFKRSLEP